MTYDPGEINIPIRGKRGQSLDADGCRRYRIESSDD